MSNNIVKHSQLHDIAGDLWTKAKKRDITALEYEATTKTIKGKNPDNPSLTISAQLTDLVSINDRAEFKKDVSVDDAKTVSNSNIGNINGPVTAGSRTTGYRGLTSKLFTDGYVKLLRIHLPQGASGNVNAHVWAIKKGTSKTEDRYVRKIVKTATVQTVGTNKYIDIDIDSTFADETFFVLRTEGTQIQGINNIKQEFRGDIINVNEYFNPQSTDTLTNWDNYSPNTDLVGHMELHGRTGIVDISKRLEEINLASGNYVLQSDTTNTGGETRYANKVVRLGDDGKINSNMIPEIAINRVLQAADEGEALRLIGDDKNHLQVGDVVVLRNTGKIYIYKGRPDNIDRNDFNRDFLEISMGNGTVKTVNSVAPDTNGNVSIDLANLPNVRTELDKKISGIALKAGDNKQLTITKADNTTSDVNLTEAFKAANISYSGQIGGAAKTNVKEAIDALKDEANKGIKSIKGGRPNADGELDVTVNTAGNGIAMTFGINGTAVNVVTYMTSEEVTAIKELFR